VGGENANRTNPRTPQLYAFNDYRRADLQVHAFENPLQPLPPIPRLPFVVSDGYDVDCIRRVKVNGRKRETVEDKPLSFE